VLEIFIYLACEQTHWQGFVEEFDKLEQLAYLLVFLHHQIDVKAALQEE
jgi:hypothetical protein